MSKPDSDIPNPKRLNRETVKRVALTFVPYKRQVALTIAAIMVSVVLGLLPPWYLKVIIDDGLAKGDMGVITRYTLYTIAATLGASLTTMLYGYMSIAVGQKIMRDLRNRLFDHLQGMSLRFFTATRTGEIQSRLINDVSGVQNVVSNTVTDVLSNIAIVVSTLIAMLYADWRLTVLSVGVIPFFAVLAAKMGNYARKVRTGTQEQTAEVTALMQETLSVSGVLLTKTSGRREMVTDRFERENQELSNWQVKAQMIQYYFFGIIRLIFSLTPALVYWLAGYLAVRGDGNITIGIMVAFTGLQTRMFFPLTGLLSAQVEVIGSFALFDRIFNYLDRPQEITDRPDAVTIDPERVIGDVEFRDVEFRYDPDADDPTLIDIHLTAKPGQLIALVGPSGAGKTTLAYLIPRLYDVDRGAVLIDGRDVRDIKLESLAQIVGAVTQETYLVHASIAENLRYAKPDATEDELVIAAKAAAIYDHIAGLSEGFNTIVGERGYKLSGGEKQRIAIARAILKNPRILILDEATSALDTRSERLIQASLTSLMSGRTTFAIAHRLSTVLHADLILVLKDGRIVEQGTHEELLALEGLYSTLYQEQFFTDDPAGEQETVGLPTI